jgi:hypothetical protein
LEISARGLEEQGHNADAKAGKARILRWILDCEPLPDRSHVRLGILESR